MILPELTFKKWHLYKEELFLGANYELAQVLVQGNPVYLDLLLPGATQPRIRICFPEVDTAWVYAETETKNVYLVGESTKQNGLPLHTSVEYRYGMELKPWLFFVYLPQTLAVQQTNEDNIVNYSILNCSSGCSGVLVRIKRHKHRSLLRKEWLEIYSFNMGNDTEFHSRWQTHPNTKLIARFVPDKVETPQLHWISQVLGASYK